MGCIGLERQIAELVDDPQFRFAKVSKAVFEPAVAMRLGELGHQGRRRHKEHGVAGQDRAWRRIDWVSRRFAAYQLHLAGLGLSWSHINQVSCALRFFFGVTVGRPEAFDRIISAKEPKKLPVVLSGEEIVRFLQAVPGLRNRTALTAGVRGSRPHGWRHRQPPHGHSGRARQVRQEPLRHAVAPTPAHPSAYWPAATCTRSKTRSRCMKVQHARLPPRAYFSRTLLMATASIWTLLGALALWQHDTREQHEGLVAERCAHQIVESDLVASATLGGKYPGSN
jgi:hypothetical protein